MKNLLVLSVVALLITGMALPVRADDTVCTGPIAAGTYDNLKATAGVCVIGPGTTVLGNIDVEPGAGLFVHPGASVKGGISKKGPGSLEIFGSAVGGNIKSEGGSSFRLHNNVIQGNLELIGNHGFPQEIFANVVRGNLKYEKNLAIGVVNISNNTIGGNLECKDNLPPPMGSANTAASKKDECAGM